MNPGNYSLRFKGVDKAYVDNLREVHSEERSELLARSRRLSADTSKRRRALALRRKTEAQREERRRQEILQKRHEQIQAVTEKYQRGNKNYSPQDYVSQDYHTPTLEEALSAVRGGSGRVRSPRNVPSRSYSASVATGGVARIGSASSVRSISSTCSLTNNGYQRPRAAPHTRYNYTVGNSTNNTLQSQLHDHSLRNMNSSRSLFEQQLEQHQQLLIEQQQESLHKFNAAIKHEMETDPKLQGVEPQQDEVPMRTDSPDSLDSLEVNRSDHPQSGVVTTQEMISTVQAKAKEISVVNNHAQQAVYDQHDYSTQANQKVASSNTNFIVHNSRSSQSPVAVVQPQVQQDKITPITTIKPELHAEKGEISNYDKEHMDHYGAVNVISTKSNGRTNGQYYQDSVIGFANEMQQDVSSALQENDLFYEKPSKEYVTTAITRAWATPSPAVESRINAGQQQGYIVAPHGATQHQVVPNATAVTFPTSATQRTIPVSNVHNVIHHTGDHQNGSGARPLPVTYAVSSVMTSTLNSATASTVSVMSTPTVTTITTNTSAQPQPTTTSANAMSSQAMNMLKHYSQFPMYTVSEPQETEDKNSLISESSTLVSGSDVADESQPEPEVRSILKRVSSYGPPLKPNKGGRISGLSVGGRHVITRSMSAHAGLRDSMEVARNRQEYHPKRAKSVRFADLDYSDDSENDNQSQNSKASSVTSRKPPRPGIRNIHSGKSPSKIPRVSSAGTERRGPFLRPHPPTHPPSGRTAISKNNQKAEPRPVVEVTNNYTNKNHNNNNQQHNNQQQSSVGPQNQVAKPSGSNPEISKAVYDANGIRLDRTPTDEEINFLWDKVRTCLSRQSDNSITDSVQAQNTASGTHSVVSQKYIDGNSLAPQFRVATRLNNTYANNYMGTTAVHNTQAKKKVSMDTLNNFTRRQNILNQRNKTSPPKATAGISRPPVSASTLTLNDASDTQPVQSTPGPTVMGEPHDINKQVSESMAAFLAAENLADHSVSDSQIEAAMEHARMEQNAINSTNPRQTVPTALSVEEQRLIKSLERLNERLRLTETNMYPSTDHTPNPPAYHAGFKGRLPISSAPTMRRQASSSGMVPRHHYRGGAATLQHTSNYGGQYRYR